MAHEELSDTDLGKAVRSILCSTRNEISMWAEINRLVREGRLTSLDKHRLAVESGRKAYLVKNPAVREVRAAPKPPTHKKTVTKKKTVKKRAS